MSHDNDNRRFVPGVTGVGKQVATGSKWVFPIYVDPMDMDTWSDLFGWEPGMACAVIPLPSDAAQSQAQKEMIAASERAQGKVPRKGGARAKNCAWMEQDEQFQEYAAEQQNTLEARAETGIVWDASQKTAEAFIKEACGILSRVELDHDDRAGTTYQAIITEFSAWQRHRNG